jgi:hypothetical protein
MKRQRTRLLVLLAALAVSAYVAWAAYTGFNSGSVRADEMVGWTESRI